MIRLTSLLPSSRLPLRCSPLLLHSVLVLSVIRQTPLSVPCTAIYQGYFSESFLRALPQFQHENISQIKHKIRSVIMGESDATIKDILNNNGSNEGEADAPHPASVQAAIARTVSRSVALYFARPVRLFRPAKVNGWQTLNNLAAQQGTTVTQQYLLSLVKNQGVLIIPKHFVPPMIINAILGTILWTSYGEANRSLEHYLGNYTVLNTVLSGAIAGACQAVAAAPAENVRILLEQGFGGQTWSCAWKEVFRKNAIVSAPQSHPTRLQDVRQLRGWLRDVGQMAGRGWNGWGWGVAKDTIGFSAFFFIFELSRHAGSAARDLYVKLFTKATSREYNGLIQKQIPAVINGVVLVSGGVIAGLTYEFIGRPFDVSRRAIHLERLEKLHRLGSSYAILRRKILEDGFSFFFKIGDGPSDLMVTQTKRNRFLRTVGRVGPWGVGFLVWETYNSRLN